MTAFLGRVVLVLAWIGVLGMSAFAVLRIGGVAERSGRFFAAVTLTGWLLAPAYVIAAGAALFRRWALLGVAILLVVAHLAWAAPDARWWSTEPRLETGSSFTVAAANLQRGNTQYVAMYEELMALDVDVLVLVEYTTDARAAFEQAGIDAEFAFAHVDDRPGFFGSAIYSRFELTDARVLDLEGYPTITAVADIDGAPVEIVAVHTLQPLAGIAVLHAQLDQLERLGTASARAMLMAGDFNATRQHEPFRDLTDGPLRDAHHALGRSHARTWPAGRRVPPFALLDHFVASDDLVFTDVGERTMPGSDHRAITATIGMPDPGGSDRSGRPTGPG